MQQMQINFIYKWTIIWKDKNLECSVVKNRNIFADSSNLNCGFNEWAYSILGGVWGHPIITWTVCES